MDPDVQKTLVEAAVSYRETYDEIRDGIEEYNNSKNPGMDVELGTKETFPVEYTADSYNEEGNACHVRTAGTAMGLWNDDGDLSVYASGIDHKDVTGFEAWLQKAGDGRIYVMPLKKTGGRFDISTYVPLPDELTEDERPSHTVTIIDKVYDWENEGGYTEKEELAGSYREGERGL